jgi:L-lactate utilization protein LutC
MTDPRDSFLDRVRKAVAAGNRAGIATDLPDRGRVGEQGAGPDPVARFRDQWTAAGGHAHLVGDPAAARDRVLRIAADHAARTVLLGRSAVIDQLDLAAAFGAGAIKTVGVDTLAPADSREAFFGADVGIGGVGYLVAETGTVVLPCGPGEPRSLSLLPPVYVAVADEGQVLPDLFDLFRALDRGRPVPSCLSLVTGPSKTGDIELRLVTGVHGPGEVHVVLVRAERS